MSVKNIFDPTKIPDLTEQGFIKIGNTPCDVVRLNGRVWSKEGVFKKQIKGWERFNLLMRTFFELLVSKLQKYSEEKIVTMHHNWEAAWHGKKVVVVYDQILRRMSRELQQTIEKNHGSHAADSPRIIPLGQAFLVRIPTSIADGDLEIEIQLAREGVPFVEREIHYHADGVEFHKEFQIAGRHMHAFLRLLPNFNVESESEVELKKFFESSGVQNIVPDGTRQEGDIDVLKIIESTLTNLKHNFSLTTCIANRDYDGVVEKSVDSAFSVESDGKGLKISVSSKEEALASHFGELFCLQKVVSREGDFVFYIPQNSIETFLSKLGLAALPENVDRKIYGQTYFEAVSKQLLNEGMAEEIEEKADFYEETVRQMRELHAFCNEILEENRSQWSEDAATDLERRLSKIEADLQLPVEDAKEDFSSSTSDEEVVEAAFSDEPDEGEKLDSLLLKIYLFGKWIDEHTSKCSDDYVERWKWFLQSLKEDIHEMDGEIDSSDLNLFRTNLDAVKIEIKRELSRNQKSKSKEFDKFLAEQIEVLDGSAKARPLHVKKQDQAPCQGTIYGRVQSRLVELSK